MLIKFKKQSVKYREKKKPSPWPSNTIRKVSRHKETKIQRGSKYNYRYTNCLVSGTRLKYSIKVILSGRRDPLPYLSYVVKTVVTPTVDTTQTRRDSRIQSQPLITSLGVIGYDTYRRHCYSQRPRKPPLPTFLGELDKKRVTPSTPTPLGRTVTQTKHLNKRYRHHGHWLLTVVMSFEPSVPDFVSVYTCLIPRPKSLSVPWPQTPCPWGGGDNVTIVTHSRSTNTSSVS